MTTAGKRIIEGAKEALSVAKGEQPAARIWHQGHAYVPETTTPKPAPSADAVIEQIAECMWQAEWKRGGNGGARKVPWTEVADTDRARYRFVAREVAALATIPTAEPAVKPLEWEPAGGDGKMSLRATAIGLRYYVFRHHDDGRWYAYTEGYQPVRFGDFADPDTAKAAAQSDYEQRIRSALVAPQPARETDDRDAEIERLRQALDLLISYGCPICHGDCASANPPVSACPMQIARSALAGEQP